MNTSSRPARASDADNPGRSSQHPLSDPEHKLGDTPAPADLARDTRLQRDGTAARSAAINANTPRPSDPEKNTTRDPDLEQSTP